MTDSPCANPEPGPVPRAGARARIGIDLVRVDEIARSVADFGSRFTARLFSGGELRDCEADGRLDVRALARRFAAKEATIKAFDLAQAGVGWAQIEVTGVAAGGGRAGRIALHGRAAEAAGAGRYDIAVSLSDDDDLACAIVVALPAGGDAAERAMRPGA